MAKFLFSYRAPVDYTLGHPDSRSAWAAWFQGMGSQLADVGQPVREARQIGDCGSGQRLAGYTVVTADSLEAALALARGCPGLQHGFGIEVGALADPADALADSGAGAATTASAARTASPA